MESPRFSIKIGFGFRVGSIVVVTGLAGFRAVSIRFGIDFTNLIILITGFRIILTGLGAGLIAVI